MELQKAIVAVLDNHGNIVGTGFIFSENHILTCAHVIEATGSKARGKVGIQLEADKSINSALISPTMFSTENDIAVLSFTSLSENVQILPLDSARKSIGKSFHSFGYATVADVQGIHARGEVFGFVKKNRLIQLHSPQSDYGLSGGPVVDENRQVAVGMISKGKGSSRKNKNLHNIYTSFAIPVDLILDVFPELRELPKGKDFYLRQALDLGRKALGLVSQTVIFPKDCFEAEKCIKSLRDDYLLIFFDIFSDNGSEEDLLFEEIQQILEDIELLQVTCLPDKSGTGSTRQTKYRLEGRIQQLLLDLQDIN